jgi:hypothetical protein
MCWILRFAVRGRRVSGVLTHIENSELWSLLRFRADHCCNSVLKPFGADGCLDGLLCVEG